MNLTLSYSGITEFQNGIKLYPNPTLHYLTIELEFEGDYLSYFILDGIGKTVSNGLIKNEFNQIDLTEFSKGTYLIVIEGFNKPFQVIKN